MEETKKSQPKAKKKWSRRISHAILIVLLIGGVYFGYQHGWRSNFAVVVEGQVYRSAQPRAAQLADWIDKYNLQTVVNLRGDAGEVTAEEKQIADQAGIDWITIRFSAYEYPKAKSLRELIEVIETADKPMLLHCRQGMDRSGTASALAAMAIGAESFDEAMQEAYVPPGPWKRKPATNYIHISDLFKLYLEWCKQEGKDPAGWEQFKHWATQVYVRPQPPQSHLVIPRPGRQKVIPRLAA